MSESQSPIARPTDEPLAAARRLKASCTSVGIGTVTRTFSGECSRGEGTGGNVCIMVHHYTANQPELCGFLPGRQTQSSATYATYRREAARLGAAPPLRGAPLRIGNKKPLALRGEKTTWDLPSSRSLELPNSGAPPHANGGEMIPTNSPSWLWYSKVEQRAAAPLLHLGRRSPCTPLHRLMLHEHHAGFQKPAIVAIAHNLVPDGRDVPFIGHHGCKESRPVLRFDLGECLLQ